MSDLETTLTELGLSDTVAGSGDLQVCSPVDGAMLGRVHQDTAGKIERKIKQCNNAFSGWKQAPAPKRGELVRLLGEELRGYKEALGLLVSAECGKILQEGLGEVQEMIDICDFAVGLSRQLYGLTIQSERPAHTMREVWHPLGPMLVISAFNFPVAVWSWNVALALVCGNTVLWKPSEKTPLTALACRNILLKALQRFGDAPEGLHDVIIGGRSTGEKLVRDKRIALVSATGSCRMGREIGPVVAARSGRSILELGGNNAIIVAPSADLELAARAIVFGAVGTCGQRCTSTRRLIVHESIYDELLSGLKTDYQSVSIGNPLDGNCLMGPLIDETAFLSMTHALEQARQEGAIVHGGERVLEDEYPAAFYVRPALLEMPAQTRVMCKETFAPILYAVRYQQLDEAIAIQNAVPQGLSSAIFTNDVREAEYFTSANGSDCGIANVNIGTSGAEIGGAFGGEKETGGGRESGSDAWKGYMRRCTVTTNYSKELPLSQGIQFELTGK